MHNATLISTLAAAIIGCALLRGFATTWRLHLGTSILRCLVLHGHPHQHKLAQEQDRDLIVIGTQDQSMLEELWLSSVIRHVLSVSPCDVLVSIAPPRTGG